MHMIWLHSVISALLTRKCRLMDISDNSNQCMNRQSWVRLVGYQLKYLFLLYDHHIIEAGLSKIHPGPFQM